jgi:hypothetical protein
MFKAFFFKAWFFMMDDHVHMIMNAIIKKYFQLISQSDQPGLYDMCRDFTAVARGYSTSSCSGSEQDANESPRRGRR